MEGTMTEAERDGFLDRYEDTRARRTGELVKAVLGRDGVRARELALRMQRDENLLEEASRRLASGEIRTLAEAEEFMDESEWKPEAVKKPTVWERLRGSGVGV